MKERELRARLNIVISFLGQIITLICGLIVPKMLISQYGSEAYGATASIIQFLSYIALLEGGIGGVARAALYRPLAEKNLVLVSDIMTEIKHFFKVIALVFLAYVFILALGFKHISSVQCFDWLTSFLLVLSISFSIFLQYFIGISYSILLQADQKIYITQTVSLLTTVLNAFAVVVLVRIGCHLVTLKLVSSFIFALRPLLMKIYVNHNYKLIRHKGNSTLLNQKWTGLGQHLAYFLHSNTDIVLLTVFANLRLVAVYSVYNMIVSSVQAISVSFTSGMEALFGDMIAKEEYDDLQHTFGVYETIVSIISVTLYSSTIVLIVPFIQLYMDSVTSDNYVQPLFSFLLVSSSLLYCLRLPYHSLIIAAGHFKQTRIAAYGEAVINIFISIVFVLRFGLVGVACGTFIAVFFRFIYYVIYLSKNIINRKVILFLKRGFVNVSAMFVICIFTKHVVELFTITDYIVWMLVGGITVIIALLIEFIFVLIFYRKYLFAILAFIQKKPFAK